MSISYQITAMFARYILVLIAFMVLIKVITLANNKKANIEQSIGLIRSLSREREFPLFFDNTIGRSSRCDIQLRNKTIDPLHIQIYYKKNKCIVSVCGKNSILLNGIEINDRVDILDGDIITLGDEEFQVELFGGEK